MYRRQLESAVGAVTFRSGASFLWLGEADGAGGPRARRAATSDAPGPFLRAALAAKLYTNFYCTGQAVTAAPGRERSAAERPGLTGDAPFVAALSNANRGTGRRDEGWEVLATRGDRVVVRKRGLTVHAIRADCLTPSDVAAVPGAHVALRLPNESLALSPGFYLMRGDAPAGDDPRGPVRVYWHVEASGAVAFVRALTSALNRAAVPFEAKVLRDPAGYGRRDAAVLYVAGGDYDTAVGPLVAVRRAVARHLRPGAPALTKELAPGVGLAEDPGGGISFGEHRCRLVADALVAARDAGVRGVAARLRAVEERFAAAGLSLDAPFLNPGSADRYPAWADAGRRHAGRALTARTPPPG